MMASNPTAEFRAEAVRVTLTSGLPQKQVAADIGVGFSTLRRWIQQDGRNPEKPTGQSNLEREIVKLRKESRVLRDGMVLLAHIRDQFARSLGSYGRPRMTAELKESGLPVGHRRVGRLMRDICIAVVRGGHYFGCHRMARARGNDGSQRNRAGVSRAVADAAMTSRIVSTAVSEARMPS